MPCLPSTILLGMPKSGTTWLHNCLYYHAVPQPCCKIKEPATFLRRPMKFPAKWPASCEESVVLDFTTNYLSFAHHTIPNLKHFYKNGKLLHFILSIREPVARAFSHYCMFIPSITSLKQVCLQQEKAWEGVCTKVRYSNMFHAVNTTNEEWSNLLHTMFPNISTRCGNRGWGRLRSGLNFKDEVFRQYNRRFRSQKCNLSPYFALNMTTSQLVQYHTKCLKQMSTNDIFMESVPVFQLALFDKMFPDAKWTIFNYEDLRNDTTLQTIFNDTQLKRKSACAKGKMNSFVVKRIHDEKVKMLFQPWTHVLSLLVSKIVKKRQAVRESSKI